MASSSFQGSPQKRAVDVNKPENQGPVGLRLLLVRMFWLAAEFRVGFQRFPQERPGQTVGLHQQEKATYLDKTPGSQACWQSVTRAIWFRKLKYKNLKFKTSGDLLSAKRVGVQALELQGVQCGRGAIFHSTKFQINTSPRKLWSVQERSDLAANEGAVGIWMMIEANSMEKITFEGEYRTPCEDPQQTSARPDEPWVRGGVDADLSGRGEGCGGVGVEVPGARSLRLPGCLRGPHRGWERSAGKRKGRRSPSGRRASGSFAPPKERGGSAVLLTTRPPPPCYRSPGPVGADTGDPLRGRGARWTLAAGSRARSCRRLPLLPRPSLSREKRCSGDLGPSLGVCAGPYPNPPREEARRGGPRCGGGKLRRDARLENTTHGGAGWTPSVLQEPAGAKPQPATQSQAQTHVA
uniref:uncharacterized protein LOC108593728 n=1 Tax=Callithrix jacchus TaxID=9483 RepID=UPI0023DD4A65|nr:uncharacterized protein LOC108593728 [Callithrix jacchus]